jgi:hypothetical protein
MKGSSALAAFVIAGLVALAAGRADLCRNFTTCHDCTHAVFEMACVWCVPFRGPDAPYCFDVTTLNRTNYCRGTMRPYHTGCWTVPLGVLIGVPVGVTALGLLVCAGVALFVLRHHLRTYRRDPAYQQLRDPPPPPQHVQIK